MLTRDLLALYQGRPAFYTSPSFSLRPLPTSNTSMPSSFLLYPAAITPSLFGKCRPHLSRGQSNPLGFASRRIPDSRRHTGRNSTHRHYVHIKGNGNPFACRYLLVRGRADVRHFPSFSPRLNRKPYRRSHTTCRIFVGPLSGKHLCRRACRALSPERKSNAQKIRQSLRETPDRLSKFSSL